MLFLTVMVTITSPSFAADETPAITAVSDISAQQMLTRLQEIRDMDKSNLTSAEKKTLRKEVKEMRKEIRDDDRRHRGVFISLGAVIIIVLLLLILL